MGGEAGRRRLGGQGEGQGWVGLRAWKRTTATGWLVVEPKGSWLDCRTEWGMVPAEHTCQECTCGKQPVRGCYYTCQVAYPETKEAQLLILQLYAVFREIIIPGDNPA